QRQQIDLGRADRHGSALSVARDDPRRIDFSYRYSNQKAVIAATSIAAPAAIHSISACASTRPRISRSVAQLISVPMKNSAMTSSALLTRPVAWLNHAGRDTKVATIEVARNARTKRGTRTRAVGCLKTRLTTTATGMSHRVLPSLTVAATSRPSWP